MKQGNDSPVTSEQTPLPHRVIISADTPGPEAAIRSLLLQLDQSLKDFDLAEHVLSAEVNRAEQIRASHQRSLAAKRFTEAWDELVNAGTIVFDHAQKRHTLWLP